MSSDIFYLEWKNLLIEKKNQLRKPIFQAPTPLVSFMHSGIFHAISIPVSGKKKPLTDFSIRGFGYSTLGAMTGQLTPVR